MTASRVNRHLRAAVLCAFAAGTLVVSNGAGLAQSGGPVSLIPKPADTSGSPQETPDRQTVPSGTVRSIPGTVDSSVQIRGLGRVDTDAVGLSGATANGLTTDMWRGTSRAVAQHLLASMPDRYASGAAHDLARRFLLMAAAPPASARGDVSLIKLRVEKLVALGAAEDAERLLRAVSARSTPKNLVEHAVLARLLVSDFAGACQTVESTRGGFVSEFGQKALIFCQLLDQKFSEAVLGLELLRDQNLAQDVTFFELSNTIVSGAEPTQEQLAKPGQANALNLALIQVAGGRVPPWFADTEAPSLLKAVAITSSADRETRLMAARRAARWGALSPAELADIYVVLDISQDDVATVLLAPENASAGLRLAAVYLAANSRNIAVARAEILREMWRLAANQQDWRLAARLTAPQLRTVQPAPAFSWFAGDAMAANLAAGDVSRALEWFQIAEGRSSVDEGAASALTELWPALRMAAADEVEAPTTGVQARVFDQSGRRPATAIPGATTLTPTGTRNDQLPWNDRRLAEWIAAQTAKGPEGVATIATTLALFDGLGEEVSNAFWLAAESTEPASGSLPPVDVWVGLARAAQAGKVAETVLYALLAVGDSEASQLHPVAIHSIVSALRQVGLSESARAFALEVAVTAAPPATQ